MAVCHTDADACRARCRRREGGRGDGVVDARRSTRQLDACGPWVCIGQTANAAIAGDQRHRQGVAIHIGYGEVVQGGDSSHKDALRAARYISNRRCVVAATDGDRDGLVDEGALVVRYARGESFHHRLGCRERLGRRLAVVQRVGPDTRAGVERHAAVSAARGTDQAPGCSGTSIHIARTQRGAGRGAAGNAKARFGNSTFQRCRTIGDHRHIVGPADGERDRLFGVGTLVVGNTGDVAHGDRVAFLQRLGCWQVIVQRIVPHPGGGIDAQRAVSRAW